MKARSTGRWLAIAVLCAVTGSACGGEGADGADGSSCTVMQNGDGSATITCEDGTSTTIVGGTPGQNGMPGTPGAPGTPGTPGTPGVPGTDGTSCSVVDLGVNAARIECEDGTSSVICGARPSDDYRYPCQTAEQQVSLAAGLDVSYVTREIADNADQLAFYPYGSVNPTYVAVCIEGDRELIDATRYNPSVQVMELSTGSIRTVLRGMQGCDGIRVTPWGTILATEEFDEANGGAYEILWSPSNTTEYTITDRSGAGTVVDEANANASATVAKRTALAAMAWEGIAVLPSGVVFAGDELRPGSGTADADGGAIIKFIPSTLRTATTDIAALSESPFVAGSSYALAVSCVNNNQQVGQGCEVGNGAWIPVSAAMARAHADANGATGYYRPEDLHVDPSYTGPGVRFCFANTGNASAANYGEVLCAVETAPDTAVANARTVTINRFLEGDAQLNAPDNLEFQPGTGVLYVIEDAGHGDVWACLPDGGDRDIKSDGCVRMLSVKDSSAEPTGFIFHPNGETAFVNIQHTSDDNMPLVDAYATDDMIRIGGFAAPSTSAIGAFGAATDAALAAGSTGFFGFGAPVPASPTVSVARATSFPGGVAPTPGANGRGTSASSLVSLASGLTATHLTRVVANHADQGEFYPSGSATPTHLVFCIEGVREEIAAGKLNPSVQAIELATGNVTTIVRGMTGCDGLRISPWGTVIASEEFLEERGGLYEILWNPATLSGVEFTIDRPMGGPETVSVTAGTLPSGVASDYVVRRTALSAMAWEGIAVLPSGVVIGGDELRPGSGTADSDGGAIFKFVPSVLRTGTSLVTALSQSPLVSGSVYALQVSCVNNNQQYGQGCEIGNGRWIAIADPVMSRALANASGATGYYRPEDLHVDPDYTGTGVRFCFANTGNASAKNYGEVLCAVDSQPNAVSTSRTVTINRLIEGDLELNAPDNLAFLPGTGLIFVIEDNGFGDVWACLPDGADRDIKSDGCVRMLSLTDASAEPTGFIFHPSNGTAYVAIQHSADPAGALVDGYATDDVIAITGFSAVTPANFGATVEARLLSDVTSLFGFDGRLSASAVEDY